MTAIISLLIIISLSILITHIGTLALVHTGISKEAAKFQARSAYMGVGFTTQESEIVVNHPVRRKILSILIFLGNAGVITTISSVIFSFISVGNSGFFSLEILVLISGLSFLLFLSRSKWVNRWVSFLINRVLQKYTRLDVTDYYSLLHLSEDYRVTEIKAEKNDWITGKSLSELQLDAEGLSVLGIKRKDGSYLGAPIGTTEINSDDIVIIYGHTLLLESLDNRKEGSEGDAEHKNYIAQKIRQDKLQK